MIGVYDSGSGGLTALSHLLRLAPRADICYLGDLPHAPYGTKTRAELIPIIEENTLRFLALGAEHILVACVTASSLYSHLFHHISPYTATGKCEKRRMAKDQEVLVLKLLSLRCPVDLQVESGGEVQAGNTIMESSV